jgi:hypothetical protein
MNLNEPGFRMDGTESSQGPVTNSCEHGMNIRLP